MAALHQQETVAHARTAAKIYSSLSADQKTKVGDHLQMLMGGGGRGFGGPGWTETTESPVAQALACVT